LDSFHCPDGEKWDDDFEFFAEISWKRLDDGNIWKKIFGICDVCQVIDIFSLYFFMDFFDEEIWPISFE